MNETPNELPSAAATPKQSYDQDKALKAKNYMELRNMIFELHEDFGGMAKIQLEHKNLITSQHVLLKNFSARIDAITEVLSKHLICTEDELNAITDRHLGVRQRLATEPIEAGDAVTVNYTATVEGKAVFTDKNFPCRAGSKTVMFDGDVIGKKVGETFDHKVPLQSDPTKEVTYTIEILKAKTKLKGETDGTTGNTEPTTETPADA
jgi:hypothetical protein